VRHAQRRDPAGADLHRRDCGLEGGMSARPFGPRHLTAWRGRGFEPFAAQNNEQSAGAQMRLLPKSIISPSGVPDNSRHGAIRRSIRTPETEHSFGRRRVWSSRL
jgi:hypothetical protein